MRRSILIPCLAALASCVHHHDHHDDGSGGGSVPVFFEREVNDTPASANYFGAIEPGLRFFIDGDVREDGLDPFDRFAFTASVPLHVDFQLFAEGPADLDICLYDPQTNETVACWATSNDPEQGGVDVTIAGLDFQLAVESFSGNAPYSLELVVLPLFGNAPLSPSGSAILGVGARSEHPTRAEREAAAAQETTASVRLERVIEFDPGTGLILERRRLLPAESR